MTDRIAIAVLATGLLLVPVLPAAAAPQGLQGKTTTVTWTESRSQKNPGDTAFHPVSIPYTFQVYVSAQGNVFKRIAAISSTRKSSGKKEGVGSGATAQVSFQGNTMTLTASSGGLGRRIRIVFDAGFSGCSAEVLTGKTGAGPATVRSIASGRDIQFESVSAGAASCAIQTGNAFAN